MSSKQREALLAVYDCAKDGVLTIRESAFEKVMKALAEPLCNCDVGTAEEQHARYDEFCNSQKCCQECPCYSVHSCPSWCTLNWAQLPYDAKEARNDKTTA